MKTTIFLSLVCTTLTLFSCQKKEYTCRCEGGFGGNGASIQIEGTSPLKALKNCEKKLLVNEKANDGFNNCSVK